MAIKIEKISQSKMLRELLQKLDADNDASLSKSEVDSDNNGLFDLNEVTSLWSSKKFRSIEAKLFDFKLIRKLRNSIPNESITRTSQLFYKLDHPGKQETKPPQVLQDIKGVYITTIHDGKPRSIFLTADQLAQNNNLEINGWVTSVIVFSRKKLNSVNFDHSYALQAKQFEDGKINLPIGKSGYTVLTPEKLKALGIDEKMKKTLFENEVSKEDTISVYSIGQIAQSNSYKGTTISDNATPFLMLSANESSYYLQIKQAAYEQWNSNSKQSDLKVFDLSSAPHRWHQIPHFDNKLDAIAKGIQEVHEALSRGFTTELRLNSYKLDNATANNNHQIFFYYDKIANDSTRALRYTARHETLHKYAHKRGLTKDSELRKLFAELLGYDGERRSEVLQEGGVSFGDYILHFENKAFFLFVNESNFAGLENGGHSHANIDEFLASFINTLFDLDSLETNLKEQESVQLKTHSQEAQEVLIDNNAKKTILLNYEKTLEAIINALQKNKETPQENTEKEVKFFSQALKRVRELKKELFES